MSFGAVALNDDPFNAFPLSIGLRAGKSIKNSRATRFQQGEIPYGSRLAYPKQRPIQLDCLKQLAAEDVLRAKYGRVIRLIDPAGGKSPPALPHQENCT